MKRVKLLIIAVLIPVAIFFIVILYLQMYVNMNTRIRRINNLENTNIQNKKTILYVDKLASITNRLAHFSVSRVSLRKSSSQHQCKTYRPKRKQSLLFVSASSRDLASIYTNILQQLQACFSECNLPQFYVIKRTRRLVFNNQENINGYALEIGEVIQYLTTEAHREISILAHEEGALLMLTYFVKSSISILQTTIIQKIRTILIIDIAHPLIRIQHDPPYRFINNLKKDITKSQQRFALFNRLRMIIVNTRNEGNKQHQYQFSYGQKASVFINTVYVSSREMVNVHTFLFPDSLSFSPFIQRIGNFLAIYFTRNMSNSQIVSLLKHGQAYIKEAMNSEKVRQCKRLPVIQNGLINSTGYCNIISPIKLTQDEVIVIYSAYKFDIYADTLQRIHPFEDHQEGNLYVFEKIDSKLYILNTESTGIYIFKQNISHPRLFSITTQQQSYLSGLNSSNYTIVRLCQNTILAVPLHITQDSLSQSQNYSGNNCLVEVSFVEQFSVDFFFHWALIRNIIIFTMLFSQVTQLNVSNRLVDQFLFNFILLMCYSKIQSKIICALCILSISLLIQYSIKAVVYICSSLTLKQKWASFVLEGIAAVCIASYYFSSFNYWKIFLLSIIFFINRQNMAVFLIKLFFIDFQVLYSSNNFSDLANLSLMTMWLYTSLVIRQQDAIFGCKWPIIRILGITILLFIGVNLDSSGFIIQKAISIYMKIIVLLRMLKIMSK